MDHLFKMLANLYNFWPLPPNCWQFFYYYPLANFPIFDPSKYKPRGPRICINWTPPFQTQIYFIRNRFWRFYDVKSEMGILIDADSVPPKAKLF